MSKGFCDICQKPAVFRVQVIEGGVRRAKELCKSHYIQYQQSAKFSSPLDSIFHSDLFNDLFTDRSFASDPFGLGFSSLGDRESVDIDSYLSEESKDVLQRAGRLVAEQDKDTIDTEHLLFVLMDSTTVQNVFKRFRLSPEDVKQHIEYNIFNLDKLKTSSGDNQETREIQLSPRVKSALDKAFRIARDLEHNYIGPEHLLIALNEIGEGHAYNILKTYGLSSESLRQKVSKVVGIGDSTKSRIQSDTPNLDKFSRDLSELAKEGKLDPVIGRSKEISTTIEILARRTKNNPVLIGEPGVGKTAIIEGLAQRIVNGEVPEVLLNKRLVELNINSMVAGSKYRGEFEERIKQVLDEIVKNKEDIVIFIDEIHTIMGAGQGGGEGGLDVANVIKPAMARGELHLIGATTLNEYQKHIEKDAALERRFQPVYVEEPSVEQAITILKGLRDKYEAHHKVRITDEALKAAAELSDRYISNRYLPDKAIDLMDQAAARVRIGSTSRPEIIQELEAELKLVKREYEAARGRKDYDRAKELNSKIETKEDEIKKQTEEWKKHCGAATPSVSSQNIADIISSLTGIPINELNEAEREKLLKLEEKLHERVIGQNEAIIAVSQAVRLSRSGLQLGSKPIASFLFLGPTGVGKTELAKSLAWSMFGDEEAVTRIDMSEYMERHTVSRLIGAPPGYVGYEEGGQLTERVRRRPYSVILLDEIEKAHPEIHNILLQVLDDGRLTDGKGRVVDFSNTVIIATSNIGSKIIQANIAHGNPELNYLELKSKLMEELKHHFRPEFINRIDDVILFHSLNKTEIRSIVKLSLNRVKEAALRQGVELDYDETVYDYFAEIGFLPEFGARELKRQIRNKLEAKLAEELLRQSFKPGDVVRINFNKEKNQIELSRVELAKI